MPSVQRHDLYQMTKEYNCILTGTDSEHYILFLANIWHKHKPKNSKEIKSALYRGYSAFRTLVATCQTLIKSGMTLHKDDLYASPAVG